MTGQKFQHGPQHGRIAQPIPQGIRRQPGQGQQPVSPRRIAQNPAQRTQR